MTDTPITTCREVYEWTRYTIPWWRRFFGCSITIPRIEPEHEIAVQYGYARPTVVYDVSEGTVERRWISEASIYRNGDPTIGVYEYRFIPGTEPWNQLTSHTSHARKC